MSEKIKIRFIQTHPDAKLPKRNHDEPLVGDTGYDLSSVEDVTVPARGSATVKVGLKLAYIQPGYWIRVESRSGLAFKHDIEIFNGIIDNPYRSELGCKLFNSEYHDYEIKKGDRIGQLAIYKLIEADMEFADSVDETKRGEKGFGSSGK